MILFSFTSIIFITAAAAIVLIAVRATLFQTGYAKKLWRTIKDWFHVYQFFQVPKLNETTQHNHLYRKVSLYLHSLRSIEESDLANLIIGKKQNDIVLCLGPNQTIEDLRFGSEIIPPANDAEVCGGDRGPGPVPRGENGKNKRVGDTELHGRASKLVLCWSSVEENDLVVPH